MMELSAKMAIDTRRQHRGLTDVEKTSCVYWDTPVAIFHHAKYSELFVPEIDPKREINTAYVCVK